MARPPKKKVQGLHVSLSLKRPSDLLAKLEWEADGLKRYWDNDPLGPSYCLINGAITAWQLGDWVAHTLDDAQRWDLADGYFGDAVRSLSELQARMRKCRALVACQQLAVAAKHMKINDDGTYRPGFAANEYFDIYWREVPGDPEGGESSFVRALEIVFPFEAVNDRPTQHRCSAQVVLNEAIEWWRGALDGMGLGAGSSQL